MQNNELYAQNVTEQLRRWDSGDVVWTIALGGVRLGPGYEQAIQVAAIEFARGCKDLSDLKSNDASSPHRFKRKCEETLRKIDQNLGGLTGAQFESAVWLAWQWCVEGGPARLVEKFEARGHEDRIMQVSKHFPHVP